MCRYKIFRADSAKALQKDCAKYAATRFNPLPQAAADVVYWSECMLKQVAEREAGHTAVSDEWASSRFVDVTVNGPTTVNATEGGGCPDPQIPIDIVACTHLWTHAHAGRDMISDLKGINGCRRRWCHSRRCRRVSIIAIIVVSLTAVFVTIGAIIFASTLLIE